MMQKFPLERALSITFYVLLVIGIGIVGYVGLSRRANQPVLEATPDEAPESSQVIRLSDCETSTEKICILSTGYDAEGNLLVSLKVGLLPMPPVYAYLVSGRLNVRFDCRIVDISPRVAYCLGPFKGDVSSVTMELYGVEDDRLMASGALSPGEMALASDPLPPQATPQPTFTPTPTAPSYPSEDVPSYPYPYPYPYPSP